LGTANEGGTGKIRAIMKAALYTPYLDTLGGGERYMLSIARALLESGWKVDIEANDPKLIDRAAKRFGFPLTGLNVVPSINRGEGYDICVWLSDGSIPTLRSKKNILHFQRPFQDVDGRSLVSRMKFFRISTVIVNSAFTKRYIDVEFPKQSVILYPPVDVAKFKTSEKENAILYVGRFSQLEQSKRQDVLLTAFLKFNKYQYGNWRLLLAGGSDVGRTEEVDVLRAHAKKEPIEVLENPSFSAIQGMYSKATFFWSAAGYGVDPKTDPQKLEHFGMTVVEAMAAGCVPVVFNGGGHPEIIEDGVNGFLWSSPQDMINITKKLTLDRMRLREISKNAVVRSKEFSYEQFKKNFLKLI